MQVEDESESEANRMRPQIIVFPKAMRDFILRHNPMFSEKNLVGFSQDHEAASRNRCGSNSKTDRSMGFV